MERYGRSAMAAAAMSGIVWSDYLCPWCYVGLDRSALMEELGVELTLLPFELHPEIPEEGASLRRRSGPVYERTIALYDRIAVLCDEVGMPFQRPPRVPNTRRVLAASEWVRRHQPDRFEAAHRGLFRAHFAEARFLGDRSELVAVLTGAGVDGEDAVSAAEGGEMEDALRSAREQALEVGVGGTPAWWLGERLLVPGLQSRGWVERVVSRLIERTPSSG